MTDSIKYIKSFLPRIFATFLIVAFAVACADEGIVAPDGRPEEGLPAMLTLPVRLSERQSVSRSDIPDNRVTSLWIGLFSETTRELKDYYIVDNISDETPEHQWREVKIPTTSGRVYAVGVANFESRYAIMPGVDGIVPLRQALLNIRDWNDYCDVAVTFTVDGGVSIDEPLKSLLMSGDYSENYQEGQPHPGNTIPGTSLLDITPGEFTAKGCIHLRRLISHNVFNVEFNKNNIESFRIVGWQVFNVPNSSWLRERPLDAEVANSGEQHVIGGISVAESEHQTVVDVEDNVVSFDFWQTENRHTGLVPGAEFDAADAYNYRDREFKNADGSNNSGKFRSLLESPDDNSYRNNATYVTFEVEMTMKVDQNGKPLTDSGTNARMVSAEYTVHLGYCENRDDEMERVRDFNCRRNTRYTYNIKINNVNSMIVEATSEKETVPSVEGNVSDISDKYYELDSHYNAVNVYFSTSDLSDFKYYMHVYDRNRSRRVYTSDKPEEIPDSGSDDFMFVSWIEFRPTGGENVIASYKPHSASTTREPTYYLWEMKGKQGGWYTMFVDEYVYERYDSSGNINEADRYNWRWFTDTEDRRVWLNVRGDESADKETIYHHSKYAISQRYMQTYYNHDMEVAALGVEHVNESLGLNLRATYAAPGVDWTTSGRYSVSRYVMNTRNSSTWRENYFRWNALVNANNFQQTNAINGVQGMTRPAMTYSIPALVQLTGQSYTQYDPDQSSSAKYVQAINACMNRNRDLDGDGYVDRNELRWFVPSTTQYIRMILGRQALKTPIMDYDNNPSLTYKSNQENSRLLLYTADHKMIWAMEGLSISSWMQYGGGAPWHVRCVRYLGTGVSDFSMVSKVEPPYHRLPGTNIIRMNRMSPKAMRTEAFTDSRHPMPVHHIADQRYNRCYEAFEVAEKPIYLAQLGLSGNLSWSDYLARNNPCASLDTDTKKGWRVPNQKEASIYSTFGTEFYQVPSITINRETINVSSLLTCTFTYYDINGQNSKDKTITSANNRDLKVLTSNGYMTQDPRFYNLGYATYKNYAIRCVRDVVE